MRDLRQLALIHPTHTDIRMSNAFVVTVIYRVLLYIKSYSSAIEATRSKRRKRSDYRNVAYAVSCTAVAMLVRKIRAKYSFALSSSAQGHLKRYH